MREIFGWDGAFAVSSNNTTSFVTRVQALQFGGSGNVRVDPLNGSSLTITVQAGDLLPLRVTKVYETGTSATSIVALY